MGRRSGRGRTGGPDAARGLAVEGGGRETLEAEHLMLKAIVEQADDAIYIKDNDRRYIMINPAGVALIQRDSTAIIGRRDEDLFEPETAAIIRAKDEQVLATGRPMRYEVSVQVPAGPRRYQTFKYPLRAADGATIGLISMVRDITTQYEAQEEVKRQNVALERANALKTFLIQTASHDLRSPLTAIGGYVELLTEGLVGSLTPEQHKFVALIGANAERMGLLIHDLLDYALLEAGVFRLMRKPTDLGALARGVVALHAPQAALSGLSLTGPDERTSVWAEVDAARVEQVLSNFVGNAVKFTPPGGRIEVTLAAEGEDALVAVTDTGPGIAPAERTRLFQPFSQLGTASPSAGVGLGLSICRVIAEAHGGCVGVESGPGGGARFCLRLPIRPPEEPAPESPTLRFT
ncbi:Aerobic respiration control sensor protein ArcB [compost metagenome]